MYSPLGSGCWELKYPRVSNTEKKFLTMNNNKNNNTKRSDADIRAEVLAEGGHLFKFTNLNNLPSNKAKPYTTMENKGYFVTTDGCILPYVYFRKSNEQGHKLRGHQRSSRYFHGRSPLKDRPVNEHGWPCSEEVSHLCHRADCIRPDHLVIEEFWKNRKRNFCGANGTCDCGNQVRCVRTYHNPETFKERVVFEKNKKAVKGLLADLQKQYPFVLLTDDHYYAEDRKRRNRNERLKRGKQNKSNNNPSTSDDDDE